MGNLKCPWGHDPGKGAQHSPCTPAWGEGQRCLIAGFQNLPAICRYQVPTWGTSPVEGREGVCRPGPRGGLLRPQPLHVGDGHMPWGPQLPHHIHLGTWWGPGRSCQPGSHPQIIRSPARPLHLWFPGFPGTLGQWRQRGGAEGMARPWLVPPLLPAPVPDSWARCTAALHFQGF